jgi:hypothetical protein
MHVCKAFAEALERCGGMQVESMCPRIRSAEYCQQDGAVGTDEQLR